MQFNRLVPSCWRVTNRGDAVALVPRLLGYSHVGHRVLLTEEGKAVIELDSADGVAEGAAATEVAMAVTLNLPQLAERMLAHDNASGSGCNKDDAPEATAAMEEVAVRPAEVQDPLISADDVQQARQR